MNKNRTFEKSAKFSTKYHKNNNRKNKKLKMAAI